MACDNYNQTWAEIFILNLLLNYVRKIKIDVNVKEDNSIYGSTDTAPNGGDSNNSTTEQPRHPQSQGCIERANGVLYDALGKWMSTNDSSSWSSALLPVTYGINTRMSTVTKTSAYQIMFGQAPRSDYNFWKIVGENGIENEEDLPTDVESNDDLIINQDDNRINLDEGIDSEIITLVNLLSNDACSSINIQLTSKTSSLITIPIPTRYSTFRTTASNHYMASYFSCSMLLTIQNIHFI